MFFRSVHPIEKLFFRIWKKGWHLSLALDTKRLSAAILPIRRWTSFMLDGDELLSTSFILSGFATIPRLLTIKPKNFLVETRKRIWSDSTSC